MNRAFVIVALAAAGLLAGCDGLGTKPAKPALAGSGMDMFAPTAVRLHPLTRLVEDEGKATVEAHVECVDQFGDTTKSPGTLVLDLYAPTLLSPKGNQLEHWEVSLDTPQDNKAAWDPITRTYVVKRPLPAGGPRKDLLLQATLKLASGATLTGELKLK